MKPQMSPRTPAMPTARAHRAARVQPDYVAGLGWRARPRAIAPAVDPASAPDNSADADHDVVQTLSAPPVPAPMPPLPSTSVAPSIATPAKVPRILIADDERRIRLAIRSCLEAEGYVVYEAADGSEALDLILRHAPDLMILDLAMPNLDGMRTLRELQSVHGQLKPRVIMLTAFGSMPAAASAISLGAAAFVEKPLTPEALRQLVARVLSEPPDADGDLGVKIDWPGGEE